ncbi:MAG: secondary thiamine-phosphate synthase enzyme YjbQ [Candidatus Aceula meridiana]|nr:secondary thiamine-phosphate synthase enzyme YjbQ [Candidatus Aceula meridiana]
MAVITEYLHFSTQGNTDILDITSDVQFSLDKTKLKKGIVTISVIGSTGALTTCEFEPGLEKDLKEIFQKLIPKGNYHHDQAWGDGNGHSRLRASLVGPSLTIPFDKVKLILGTWQQIIFLDFDNRARKREIVLQFIGE